MSNSLVPFGKYKGQPVEVLAADTDYLEWLRDQPWFKQRFAYIDKQIVVVQHGSSEPHETPEHNRLQARFLDDDFCWAFLNLATKGHWSSEMRVHARAEKVVLGRTNALWETVQKECDTATARLDKTIRLHEIDPEQYEYSVKNDREKRDHLLDQLELLRNWDACSRVSLHRQFEQGGVDVTLSASQYWEYPVRARSWSDIEPDDHTGWSDSFKIELKTQLGDDYPAVLRQMNASESNVLVYDQFESAAITSEQLETLFADSGKKVITLAEIEKDLRPG